jgi:signal transducing adaptor molecule
MTGPPFVFDPDATYPDQNVQAWAQYYAQGGTDPTGSVYFVSVPGITDAPAPPAAAAVQPTEGQQQPQPQQQQQLQRAGSVSISGAAAPTVDTQVHHQRQNSLPNPYGPLSASSAESVGGVQRQVSLPNPYGLNSPLSGENVGATVQRNISLPNPYGLNSPLSAIGENVGGTQGAGGPASAGPEGPHAGARAPWQTATTTLAGQFAQMRVGGEPSVGA